MQNVKFRNLYNSKLRQTKHQHAGDNAKSDNIIDLLSWP